MRKKKKKRILKIPEVKVTYVGRRIVIFFHIQVYGFFLQVYDIYNELYD